MTRAHKYVRYPFAHTNMSDSPYGSLIKKKPNTYFIDLRQIRANLLQILTKIISIHKMHVQNIQGCHFLKKKKPTNSTDQKQTIY